MKTNTNTANTKKNIQSVLRTLNRTAIFRLYKTIYGSIDRNGIYDFIRTYAPTNSICKQAYALAYGVQKSIQDNTHGHFAPLTIQRWVDYLKENCENAGSAYAKMPVLGRTHLYFCSPAYGFGDYNKVCALPIEGNEKLCKLAISYAQRYFN